MITWGQYRTEDYYIDDDVEGDAIDVDFNDDVVVNDHYDGDEGMDNDDDDDEGDAKDDNNNENDDVDVDNDDNKEDYDGS